MNIHDTLRRLMSNIREEGYELLGHVDEPRLCLGVVLDGDNPVRKSIENHVYYGHIRCPQTVPL
jgi:hypothetical protein